MSLSESSTQATYRFRYDVVAAVVRRMRFAWIAQLVWLGGSRGCSSMAEHQLPKLTVRVRFSSPAPTKDSQVRPACRHSGQDRTQTAGERRARYVPECFGDRRVLALVDGFTSRRISLSRLAASCLSRSSRA